MATAELKFYKNGVRLVAEISGSSCSEDEAQRFAQQIVKELEAYTQLLMDLTALTGASILARKELILLQNEIKNRGAIRTAYLSATPRMRGMCMMIVHTAGDDSANVALTHDDAEHWLSSDQNRTELRMAQAFEAGARMKQRAKKGAAS